MTLRRSRAHSLAAGAYHSAAHQVIRETSHGLIEIGLQVRCATPSHFA